MSSQSQAAVRQRPTLLIGALAALAIVVELIVVTTLLPAAGSAQRGAPLPIVFQGVIFGLISGLTAAGIVLIYRSMRVINFAQTAIGGAGFALFFNFVVLTPVPFPIALAFGLLVSAGLGLAFELIFVRRFSRAPRVVLTVFTIVSASFLGGVARGAVNLLPIFPPPGERTIAQLSGSVELRPHLPFSSFTFTLPGSPVQF
ncbi:MAG: hypothetical protein ACRDI1_10445, partial [Actinomycetota bacterium]